MDAKAIENLISTVELIATTLDAAPDSWRHHLQAVRSITASLELSDSTPDEVRRRWQVPLIGVFQRLAFAEADSGGVPDVANCKYTGRMARMSRALTCISGCLRQALTLLQVYPEDVDLLTRVFPNDTCIPFF
jgi:hypothetical protein